MSEVAHKNEVLEPHPFEEEKNPTLEKEHLRAATTDGKAIESALNRINETLGSIRNVLQQLANK